MSRVTLRFDWGHQSKKKVSNLRDLIFLTYRSTTKSHCWSTLGASCWCSLAATDPSTLRVWSGSPMKSPSAWPRPDTSASISAWTKCWTSPNNFAGSRSTTTNMSAWKLSSSSLQVPIQTNLVFPSTPSSSCFFEAFFSKASIFEGKLKYWNETLDKIFKDWMTSKNYME